VDLQTLGNLAEVVGTLTVLGGGAFGLLQFNEYRSKRRDEVAVETVRLFQDSEFSRCLALVRELPDGVSARELHERGTEFEEAAMRVAVYYEALGLLTFRRIVPFAIVRELTGGICVVAWRKLARWTEDVRKIQQQDSFAEWFQWLAERLRETADAKNANPAYKQHANWRPRG
jgi:hypothetical protein